MTSFPGFTLPPELARLREQIRRIVQDEIVPIEQRIDPDAADLPEEDYTRLASKIKSAGLWCLGAPEAHGGGGLASAGTARPGCGASAKARRRCIAW